MRAVFERGEFLRFAQRSVVEVANRASMLGCEMRDRQTDGQKKERKEAGEWWGGGRVPLVNPKRFISQEHT